MPPTTLATPRDDETAATAVRDPLLEMQLGEYVVKRRLGQGGMGVVYAGLQPIIQKPVAIKVLLPDACGGGSDEVARLIAEARAANAVRHRGIVDVFSCGSLPDGRPYLVMELLEGEPLDQAIARDAPFSLVAALEILDDLLDTLSAAHAAGVIHRDLKPGNLFLVRTPDGRQYTKVLDFGLAKRAHVQGGLARQTRASVIVGTPHYMAPEQARGQAVGPRTDLYAVGCIAFELLTGRLPFDSDSALEVASMHLSSPVPPPSTLVPNLPSEVEDLVLRLLEKDPERRPASALVVRQQIARLKRTLEQEATALVARPAPRRAVRLDDAGLEPTEPKKAPALETPPARARPSRRALALGLGVAAAAALGVGLVALQARRSPESLPPPPPPALTSEEAGGAKAGAQADRPPPAAPESLQEAAGAEVRQPVEPAAPEAEGPRAVSEARPAPEPAAPKPIEGQVRRRPEVRPVAQLAPLEVARERLQLRARRLEAALRRRQAAGASVNAAHLTLLKELASEIREAATREQLEELGRDLEELARQARRSARP